MTILCIPDEGDKITDFVDELSRQVSCMPGPEQHKTGGKLIRLLLQESLVTKTQVSEAAHEILSLYVLFTEHVVGNCVFVDANLLHDLALLYTLFACFCLTIGRL